MRSRQGRVAARRVIALADSARLDNFRKQPGAKGFTVFNAIDSRDGSVPEGFDPEFFVLRYGRSPLPGEMGCAISHLAVMREFAAWASDEEILVVAEDDARLSPYFEEDLPVVLRSAAHADVLMLANGYSVMDGPFWDRGARWLTLSPLGRRVACRRGRPRFRWVGLVRARVEVGTVCYAVTASAARRISEHAAAGVYWVADDARMSEELDLRVYHVRPYLAQQAIDEDGSIRADPMKPLLSESSWATRLRIRTRLRRLIPSAKLGFDDARDRVARLKGSKRSAAR